MIPTFSFNDIKFSVANGKHTGILNIIHNQIPGNSQIEKYELEGSVVENGKKEHVIDLTFGCSNVGASITIIGTNNQDKKRFRLVLTPKIGLGLKFKIEGMYGSRSISMVTDGGLGAIGKVFETLISFVV